LRALAAPGLMLTLAQCAPFTTDRTATEAPVPADARSGAPDYWRDVRPVLDARCVTCHACYDAPCQLNLAAAAGVQRGASRERVYSSVRLRPSEPTRLFIDEATTAGWRARGFYSVIEPEGVPPGGSGSGGLLMQMLVLKQAHPLPDTLPLPEGFEFGTSAAWNCPAPDEFERFARKNPLAGMPYGLPGLAPAEQRVLLAWLAAGAPVDGPPPLPAAHVQRVAEWEAFLNGAAPKERLMARYLYEHLFLGSLYFADLPGREFFRLVRSTTPPGQPVAVIATRLPFDDPGPTPFWYRLVRDEATPVAKTHLPYELGPDRMARFRALFLEPDYDVSALMGYGAEVASNPFVVYQAVPVNSRYRFLLDDAEFFIRGFMKGPVCRGDVAVDVIDDRFWVFFVNPDSPVAAGSGDFLARETTNLKLPAGAGVTVLSALRDWRRHRDGQISYLKAKEAILTEVLGDAVPIDLDLVWDGDGRNSNAALTIFRNADNAAVIRGLIGEPPKTAWILDYALLERIHYLLVAGYDVYGITAANLETRLYMDFLRMEGEFNFLELLPRAERRKVRDYWYRDTSDEVRDFVYGSRIAVERETAIPYRSGNPRTELMTMLRDHLARARDQRQELRQEEDPVLRRELAALGGTPGEAVALLPELSVLAVVDAADDAVAPGRLYSLMKDTGHSNVAYLFGEEERLLPAENRLTVARGFVGAYPNALWRVAQAELPEFVARVGSLRGEYDYRALVARFGVERTSPRFWPHMDALASAYASLAPVDAAVLDLARLENR
jgi:hypothetical protein